MSANEQDRAAPLACCPHGRALHDGDLRYEEPLVCCVEGCPCGKATVDPRAHCRNCGGALSPEPLAAYRVTHATGALLCPGHTTVSADGSNTAQRAAASESGRDERV